MDPSISIRLATATRNPSPTSLSTWNKNKVIAQFNEQSPKIISSTFLRFKHLELVKAVSVAAGQLCKLMNNGVDHEESVHSKLVARCLTSQLSPAIYQILSDGLLPNVNTFFGQVNNSVWRVVEASVKKGLHHDQSIAWLN